MKNFNGGYIKASQEAFDLLVKLYKDKSKIQLSFKGNYFVVFQDIFVVSQNKGGGDRQFYINNGELSWDRPIIKRDFMREVKYSGIPKTTPVMEVDYKALQEINDRECDMSGRYRVIRKGIDKISWW